MCWGHVTPGNNLKQYERCHENNCLSEMCDQIIICKPACSVILVWKSLGWMDELGFYVPSTVFQSFRDDGRWTWKALCNETPFRFGKNLDSTGIRTRDPKESRNFRHKHLYLLYYMNLSSKQQRRWSVRLCSVLHSLTYLFVVLIGH